MILRCFVKSNKMYLFDTFVCEKIMYIFSLVHQENTGFPYLVLVTVTSPHSRLFYRHIIV